VVASTHLLALQHEHNAQFLRERLGGERDKIIIIKYLNGTKKE
jgi:hypothetical protein